MRKIDCDICDKKNIPLNETLKIDNKVYCTDCLESNFPNQDDLKNKDVVREFDPTVCSSCGKDFGNFELKKISIYPICDDCEIELKNKTFPLWVKAFFVGILIIVIGSFAWNWKYYQAYNYIQESNAFFDRGDFEKGADLMKKASENVPEVEDLRTIYQYFHGIELLYKDKGTEALAEFNLCKDKLPEDYNINSLIIQAKIGDSFDKKDYEGFLEATKEYLALDSTYAAAYASVASAYACIYADQGQEDAKNNTFLYLNKAKAIDDSTAEMNEYYNMIEYRIYSKKIIRREEFVKQFPNGWSKK